MNVAMWLSRSARRDPDAIAIRAGASVSATYAQLELTVDRVAGWLRSRCTLEAGDRVALVGRNRPEYIELLFGVWRAGVIAVPINFRLHAVEIAYILGHSGARLCVCDTELVDGLVSSATADEKARDVRIIDWDRIRAEAAVSDRLANCGRTKDDLAWLFYTSGTTGRPKGVMLSHENLRQMVLNFTADVMQPCRDHAFAHVGPLSHGSGMYLLASIAAGACNLVPDPQDSHSRDMAAMLADHRHIVSFLAPTMVRRLLDDPDCERFAAQNIDLVVYGGGPMLLAGIEEAVSRIGPRFAQIYGQGESPMTITRLQREDIARSARGVDPQVLASAGQPFTGVEVRILDERGRSVPEGEIGEVAVRGPTVMRGYWRNDEATARQIRDGWLWTGDLGSFDDRGYLTLRDRSKDVIISGGINIYPREVEEVLAQHPEVAEVAVVGSVDPDWGERVVAFIVTRAAGRVPSEQLEELCRSRIASFKRPREYRFLTELPKNAYGKVLKRELRAQLATPGTRFERQVMRAGCREDL